MFTVLSEGFQFDVKKPYSETVAETLDFEINALEESIKRYALMIDSTKAQLDAYAKDKQNIAEFKQMQIKRSTDLIKASDQMRSAIIKRMKKIDKLIVKMTSLKQKGVGDYGKSTCSILFKEELKSLEKYLNHYNRNYETYCRDKNVIEHLGEDELSANLSNYIAIERSRIKDYEKTMIENTKRVAELKVIRSLIEKKNLIPF